MQAHAATQASCTSAVSGGGKAQGCAWAEADAYAVSVAYAEAHASATAEAFASWCVCENAEAWAFGSADLMLALIAEAHAEAKSIACASGALPLPPGCAAASCRPMQPPAVFLTHTLRVKHTCGHWTHCTCSVPTHPALPVLVQIGGCMRSTSTVCLSMHEGFGEPGVDCRTTSHGRHARLLPSDLALAAFAGHLSAFQRDGSGGSRRRDACRQ